MAEGVTTNEFKKQSIISPREFVFKYIRYLPWLIISVSLMLVLAYIKIRYSTPIYDVAGKLLVSSQQGFGNSGDKFDNMFMGQTTVKISDEIEVIRSRSMASRVIRSLNLNTRILNKGKIRSTTLHHDEAPFDIDIINITDSSRGFTAFVKLLSSSEYQINGQTKKYVFGEQIVLPDVKLRLIKSALDRQLYSSDEFIISWVPVESMAAGLGGSIKVNQANDYTNVLSISYQTENPRLGVDIVNQYMLEYQELKLEDKREINTRTLQFIKEQLDTVRYDLGGVENNLLRFREKHKIFNEEQQSELFFKDLSETGKQVTELGLKLKVCDYLINYLSDTKNTFKMVPSALGIDEPSLIQQITEFNRLELERETSLKNTPAGNPNIRLLETAIEKLHADMLENLRNVRQTCAAGIESLNSKNSQANAEISSIPTKQKQLLDVTRQQKILQELYSFLLQKKLETAIASASTISNIKVVESGLASGYPSSPNSRFLYTIALFIGIGMPIGIIFLLEYFNDRVRGLTEIEQLTDTPILGQVGHADEANTLVVTRDNRKFLAEQFRIVRSNLQYILPKAEKLVILVTSSFSGEGKSFVSTNLGSVMAISGKRTVILEFDIRKPKIMKGLGLNERKGITNYIVGNLSLSEIIYPVPEVENLFVIPCGPIPPNPSEMLLNERISLLFKQLREQFDVIIIDSAPVGLVSDGITLGQQADATVYIVRHNYTFKKQITFIDELYHQKKLPHLSIIVNDIKIKGGYGGYYGYNSYSGYGYGYGNGESYFDNSGHKKEGLVKRIKKIFS
jgi:tyrosine-protein kinase Etk/Wzc